MKEATDFFLQGPRIEQQDACAWKQTTTQTGGRFVAAIADGHRVHGDKASTFVTQRAVASLLAEPVITAPGVRELFLELHRALAEHFPAQPADGNLGTGTTLSVAFKEGSVLTTAYVGDSEIWLYKDGELKRRTAPHRIKDNPHELARLERTAAPVNAEHAMIARIPGLDEPMTLNITRSLGEVAFEPYVLHEPTVETIQLSGTEKFLLLGTDGFWDVTVQGKKKLHALKHILETANTAEEAKEKILSMLERTELVDNTSLLIVKL